MAVGGVRPYIDERHPRTMLKHKISPITGLQGTNRWRETNAAKLPQLLGINRVNSGERGDWRK